MNPKTLLAVSTACAMIALRCQWLDVAVSEVCDNLRDWVVMERLNVRADVDEWPVATSYSSFWSDRPPVSFPRSWAPWVAGFGRILPQCDSFLVFQHATHGRILNSQS